jgi:hypothetical protein
MSEIHAPHPDTNMIESIYPYSIDIPVAITKISREFTRNSTLLLKLIKLLQKEGAQIDDPDNKIIRITKKLQNLLLLSDTYQKTYQEEYNTLSAELDKAILERDELQIRRRIDEIFEEEYYLKLPVADWTVEDLRVKKTDQEKSLKALENLKGLTVFKDVDDLYQISKNNYHSLNVLELEPSTLEILINTLSKILETVTPSGPSTL